jgi:hypothetical protein
MLYQLAMKENQKIKLLIDNFGGQPDGEKIKSCGINLDNCGYHFYHFGSHKDDMKNKSERYYNEIELSKRATEFIIKDGIQLDIFNKIYNLKDNEGCFC